jgi:hypothetical protein
MRTGGRWANSLLLSLATASVEVSVLPALAPEAAFEWRQAVNVTAKTGSAKMSARVKLPPGSIRPGIPALNRHFGTAGTSGQRKFALLGLKLVQVSRSCRQIEPGR